jgi:hypothetical protein
MGQNRKGYMEYMKNLIWIILAFLMLLIAESYAEDPSWYTTLKSGDYQMKIDRGSEYYFRHIAKDCKTAIRECEENIDKSFPTKLFVPKDVQIVYPSKENGDCAVTIAVNKNKLNSVGEIPKETKSFISSKNRTKEFLKKGARKGMSYTVLKSYIKDILKVDLDKNILLAFASEKCYNKFNSNASIETVSGTTICLSSFKEEKAMILGAFDEEGWILE